GFLSHPTALVCCLAAVCYSAPPKERSMHSSDLIGEVEHAKSLVKKILSDVTEVHHSCVIMEVSRTLTISCVFLGSVLDLLCVLGNDQAFVPFQEVSLNHMAEGIQLHQHLLQEVEGKLTCSDRLTPFLADLRDLSAHVHQVQQLAKVTPTEPHGSSSDLSSRLHGDYQVQVAIHLILQQLQSFGQDMFRTLRHILLRNPPSTI
uniref:Colony stimulating factor 3 (granulocyte) a n=1 Tax=Electrophorus electricus TaxID=8005 RepID=A0A4W4GFD9_ELEEL